MHITKNAYKVLMRGEEGKKRKCEEEPAGGCEIKSEGSITGQTWQETSLEQNCWKN